MAKKLNLREKDCACCAVRLDRVNKKEIREVSTLSQVDKINYAKPYIAKRGANFSDSPVKVGDLICMRCINNANRYDAKTHKTQQFASDLFRDNKASALQIGCEARETIRLSIPS